METGATATGDNGTIAANPGNHLTFTLTYSNTGAAATGADSTVTDDLAQSNLAQLLNVTAAGGSAHTVSGTVVTWTVGAIASGGTGTVTFTGQVPTTVTTAVDYCNAGVLHPGEGTPPVNSNSVCAHVTVTPPPPPAPHIAKSILDVETGATSTGTTISARPGDHLTFTLTYSNSGTVATKADSTVTDDLAQSNLGQLQNVTAAGGTAHTISGSVITWTVGAIAPGATGTVSFTGQVPSTVKDAVDYCNVGVLHPGEGSPPVNSNSVCAHVTVVVCNQPAPAITMTGPAAFTTGEQAQYTVTIQNGGVANLVTNTVTVNLPAGFIIGQTQPTGQVSGSQVVFSFASLAANATQTMTITVTVPATAPAGNMPATAVWASTQPVSAGCPPVQTSVNAGSSGSVTPVVSQVQGISSAPAGALINTPSTGAAGDAIRYGIVGLCLAISGMVIVTGLRRNPHAIG